MLTEREKERLNEAVEVALWDAAGTAGDVMDEALEWVRAYVVAAQSSRAGEPLTARDVIERTS